MKWLLILFLFLASHFTYAETVSLEGVWQIQSTVYDGEEQSIRMPKQIKMFTGEHFFYTYYDPGLGTAEPQLSVGHGRYTLNNGTLSETIINHSIRLSLDRHSALPLNSARAATRSSRS